MSEREHREMRGKMKKSDQCLMIGQENAWHKISLTIILCDSTPRKYSRYVREMQAISNKTKTTHQRQINTKTTNAKLSAGGSDKKE